MFGWWRKKTATLPFPEGPYATGCTEIMDDYSKDSLFVRLLYPTDTHPSNLKKRSNDWIEWLTDEKYIEAFAALLNIWLFVLKLIMFFVKKTYIPTLWEEPVSSEIKKLPVVVFSHGYGATRFLCSTVCNELASRGYIVAAVEHKDLSASITYFYESEKDRDQDKKSYIMHIPFSTADHYHTRNKQLKKRASECSRVLNLLEDINNGNGVNVLKSNFDLKSLEGKIDTSQSVMMGHSFGGATTLYTLATDPRFKYGVILDGWMFPLKEENITIPQPLLFINTQTFHLEANIRLMKKFSTAPLNTLYTIKNTTHESNTDTPLIYGYWLNIFMRKLKSRIALKIQNYLILEFLHKHAGLKIDKDNIDGYLKLQQDNLTEDFILFAKVPMKRFSVF